MKIKVEIDESLSEEEVIIRCPALTEQITKIQQAVQEVVSSAQRFVFFKGNTEYYLKLNEVLFFETGEQGIDVHTKNDIYQTKLKLYELEEILPGAFMRVSKSTILNTHHVYSINRNLTASSVVSFSNTHKQVYVSRHYYKPLTSKLEEKRLRK